MHFISNIFMKSWVYPIYVMIKARILKAHSPSPDCEWSYKKNVLTNQFILGIILLNMLYLFVLYAVKTFLKM